MSLASRYALGRNTEHTAVLAATFGTWSVPPATGSMRVMSGSVEITEDRKTRADARQSRSLLERIQGRRTASFDVSTYVLGPGGATPPDASPYLTAALGVETIGGSDVAYSLSASQELPPSLNLHFGYNGVLALGLRGAVVETMTLNVPGGDEPSLQFQGPAVGHLHQAYCEHDGDADGSGGAVTVFDLANAEEYLLFAVGMLFSIGSDTNSGAGFTVATAPATGAITFTPGLATNQDANVEVRPVTLYSEAQTSGSPVAAIDGRIDIGSDTDLLIQSARVILKNNWKAINQAAFQQYVVDFIPGFREVSGEITFWGRVDDIKRWAFAQQHAVTANVQGQAVSLRLGTLTTGDPELLVEMPRVIFDFANFDAPDAGGSDEASFTLPFVALATTATAENELALTFKSTT